MRFLSFILLFLISSSASTAQGSSDTVLSHNDLLQVVQSHHPVSVQARTWKGAARSRELRAKGRFDPVAFASVDRKAFEDQTYYELLDGGVKFPTWFGAELETGFKRTRGIYSDPQERPPSNGFYYARLSIPLGQGLFIDERRTELRKAKFFAKGSEQEKRKMLNKLTFEASKAYRKWYSTYHQYQVRQRAFELAKGRYRNVRESIRLVASAAIDSSEARVLLENRRRTLQKGALALKNAEQELATFLWKEGTVPLKLDSGVSPSALSLKAKREHAIDRKAIKDSIQKHPMLKKAELKVERSELERRWARERLKPESDVHYDLLAEPLGPATRIEPDPSDRKLGLSFRFPLFLRSERGDLKQKDVELKRSRNRRKAVRRNLLAKAFKAHNEVGNLRKRLASYRQSMGQLMRLVEGARKAFERGASSLFMVNQRESRYIKARVRSIKVRSDLGIARERLRYRLGMYQ